MSRCIAIVGARRRTDRETIDRLVAGLPADTVIVSGGAIGPDTWAEEAARKRGLATKIFRPDLHNVDTLSQGQITRRVLLDRRSAGQRRSNHPTTVYMAKGQERSIRARAG
jgi:YspA, cpYpsA-related SLOG family